MAFPIAAADSHGYLADVSQLGNQDLVSDYIFTCHRESHSLPDMFFLLTFNYFVPFGVIENRFTIINFKYFNENCDYSSCPGWWILFLYASPRKGLAFWKNYLWTSFSFSCSLKITCILLRQVISLKKMVVLPVSKINCFNIMVSYLHSFNPFISINEIGKYLSRNIVNSMESRHPWWTHIRVKRSARRPFILILDSILVYAT